MLTQPFRLRELGVAWWALYRLHTLGLSSYFL